MAYTLGNKCAKNLCKRIVLLQRIIENVVTCFFGTQCIEKPVNKIDAEFYLRRLFPNSVDDALELRVNRG